MNAQGWFFLNERGGRFSIEGAVVQVDVTVTGDCGVRVRVETRDKGQGEGGAGRIIQDVELRVPGDSAKVVVEDL